MIPPLNLTRPQELHMRKMKFTALIAASLALLGITDAASISSCFSPNLGEFFSGSTGQDAYVGTYPLSGRSEDGFPKGRDDSVALFVGGDFRSKVGAEIEGKIVTLGNLRVDAAGAGDLVQVGLGSQIIPNNGQQVILVGGVLQIDRDVRVMTQNNDPLFFGDIVYRGGTNNGTGTGTISSNRRPTATTFDPSLDLSVYEDALAEIQAKSQFWSQLPANGNYTDYFDNPPEENESVFSAGDGECIQVFHLTDELTNQDYGIDIKFDSSLEGKTIIINVKADSGGEVLIQRVGSFYDSEGGGSSSHQFNPDFTASILWNFYDAKHVTLGTGVDFGQYQGTILVPNGDLTVRVPGTNGRVIVGGDVTQDFSGGEFHNYEFDPVCPLPLPNCTDPATMVPNFSDPTPTAPIEDKDRSGHLRRRLYQM